MPEEIAQFKDEFPIIRDVPIESKAKSQEAFAKVLGNVANELETQAVAASKAEKEALILHDTNQIVEAANQAKIDMRLQPQNAAQIYKNAVDNTTSMLNQVPQSYREKVRAHFDVHMGSVGLEYATIANQQRILTQRNVIYDEVPRTLEILRNITDPDEFETKSKEFLNTIHNSALSGVISPQYQERVMQQYQAVIDRNQAIHNMYEKGATAHQYSHVENISFTNNDTNLHNRPSEEHHEVLQAHASSEQTKDAALADANLGIFPDQKLLAHLKTPAFQEVANHYSGALKAKSAHEVGKGYDFTLHRIGDLESMPGLSEEDQGELKYHQSIVKQLENLNYKQVINNTNAGARDLQAYTNNKAAISSATYNASTPEEAEAKKQQELVNNELDLMNKQIANGDALGIPRKYFNVLPDAFILPISDSFGKGKDVSGGVNAIYQLPLYAQYYATLPLKNPVEKAAVWNVALRKNTLPSGQAPDLWSTRMMMAAQEKDKDYYKPLEVGKEERMSDAKIRLAIQSQLSDVLSYIHGVPEGDLNTQVQWTSGTTELGVNYVKDRMLESGKFIGGDVDDYIKEYTDNTSRNYSIYSGTHFAYNLHEVPYTKSQLDNVTSYLLHNLREVAQEHYAKLPEEQHEYNPLDLNAPNLIAQKIKTLVGMAFDLNHPIVTNTRSGEVAIVSPDGIVLEHKPLTQSLVNAAQHYYIEQTKEIEKERQFQMMPTPYSMEQSIFGERNEMITPGNISLDNRPVLKNADGSYSTVRTITTEIDGKTILLPTIIDGKQVSNKEAIEHYKKTGEHMGIFTSQKAADEYDEKLHNEKGWHGKNNKWEEK